MTAGSVKWFDPTKGFGFIASEGGGKDDFVHHNAISDGEHAELAQGQRLEFESALAAKGPQATRVRLV
jgi:CspA family cold shock protein